MSNVYYFFALCAVALLAHLTYLVGVIRMMLHNHFTDVRSKAMNDEEFKVAETDLFLAAHAVVYRPPTDDDQKQERDRARLREIVERIRPALVARGYRI